MKTLNATDYLSDHHRAALYHAGFLLEDAEDVEDALALLDLSDYGAVITDEPALVSRIRAAQNRVPILMLSLSDAPSMRVDALNGGADDTLSAPGHPDEVVARLRSIVRRAAGHADNRMQVGPIELDPSQNAVFVNGKLVHFTGLEFATLRLLALRTGRLVTKPQFMDHLYAGRDEPEPKIIDVLVCKIRAKLRAAGASGYLQTVWGQGYSLRDTPLAEPEKSDRPILQRLLTVLRDAERPLIMRTLMEAMPDVHHTQIRAAIVRAMSANQVVNEGRRPMSRYAITKIGQQSLAAAQSNTAAAQAA